MEVASPLPFPPAGTGAKRSLACSPQLIDPPNHNNSRTEMEVGDEPFHPVSKRRRFQADTSVESLSERLSAASPFFANGKPNKNFFSVAHAAALKRQRFDGSSSPQRDLAKVVEEQESIIESFKKDKSEMESSMSSLKTDHERVVKENQILRKAVSIQQERQNQAENELKAAHQYRADAEDKMKKLEQLVLQLRYHLQAQQSVIGNDFMHQRPPDVF